MFPTTIASNVIVLEEHPFQEISRLKWVELKLSQLTTKNGFSAGSAESTVLKVT